jgi:arabinose-5-phosphate isomerase
MHRGDAIPAVPQEASLRDALVEMTAKGLGMTAVVDPRSRLLGIFTDGDLRRALDRGADIRSSQVRDLMTRNCKTAVETALAAEALEIMERNKISGLLIVGEDQRVVGALNMHDLLRAGVV